MLVYRAQEKSWCLCCVQDTFVSNTPLGVVARGSVHTRGSNSDLVSNSLRIALLDVDIGPYSARTAISHLLRPRNLCVHYAFESHGSWFSWSRSQVRNQVLYPASSVVLFQTVDIGCWCWMLMLVDIAQKKSCCLCYVLIPFCPLRPWELWLVVPLVQSPGSNPGLVSTMVRSRSGSFPKPTAGAARLR